MSVKPLAALAALLVLAGCSSAPPPLVSAVSPVTLEGKTWHLSAFGSDTALTSEAVPTAEFALDGALSGTAGCNRYMGSFERDGRDLSISPLGATKRMCAPAIMQQEQRFMEALQSAASWSQDGAALLLSDASGEPLLRFTAPISASGASATNGSSPTRATLNGVVTYRQRIALPSSAIIEVKLLDISLADAPSVTLATHRILTDGQQVPIPFSLAYDPSAIRSGHTYSVRADVRDAGGALLWTTDTVYPVLAEGESQGDITVMLAQVDGTPPPAPEAMLPLAGTSWRVTRFDTPDGGEVTPEEDLTYTLTFTDDLVSGMMACNNVGAAYTASGGKLTILNSATTAAVCLRAHSEPLFLSILRQATAYTVSEDALFIRGAGGAMAFERTSVEQTSQPRAQRSTLAAEAHAYQCSDASGKPFQFTVRKGQETLRVALPALHDSRILDLARVTAADDSLYEDDDVRVSLAEREATLTVGATTFDACTLID